MANEYLTVQQAQYLLSKWKTEADSTYAPKASPSFTGAISATGTLSLGDASTVTSWLSALGLNNSASSKDGSATTCSNNTDTTLCNTGSLAAGTYILKATAQFATNATGYRMLFFATSTSGSQINRYARVIGAAANGTYTEKELVYIATISAATTFYLRARQTSGGNLSVTGGIQILKIH